MAKSKKGKGGGFAAMQKKQDLKLRLMAGEANARMREAYVRGYSHAMIMALWSLHETEGFGKMRMQRAFKRMQNYLQEYKVGLNYEFDSEGNEYKGIQLEDVAECLMNEYDIIIDPKTGRYKMNEVPELREEKENE